MNSNTTSGGLQEARGWVRASACSSNDAYKPAAGVAPTNVKLQIKNDGFQPIVCAEAIAHGILKIGIIGSTGRGADNIPAVSSRSQAIERKRHIRVYQYPAMMTARSASSIFNS